MVIWFTGLSGSGKSTLALALADRMQADGITPLIIDGDVMRLGLTSDLGFCIPDRSENVRRAGGVAIMAAKSGIFSICSLISPLRKDRELVRMMAQANGVMFIEIFVDAALGVCEKRDPKGLYKKARAGKIPDFTGISSPYEKPLRPELIIKTSADSVEEALKKIYLSIAKLEPYILLSQPGFFRKLCSRTRFAFKKIIPNHDVLRQMGPFILPLAYLLIVLIVDFLLPIRTITPPLLRIGVMICGLTLRPRFMLLWTGLYTLVDGLLMFCRPANFLLCRPVVDFDLAANAVHFIAFVFTGILSFLVSYSLTSLRDRAGAAFRVLIPRTY